MDPQPNNYDVFEDRVQSLLKRWRTFLETNPGVTPESGIRGCLQEINDGFTASLMEADQ